MFEKTILNFQGLELKVSDDANEGILGILNHSVQGSEGGIRFSFQNIDKRIAAYRDQIRFISLYKKNKITATVGACFRVSGQGVLQFPSTYIRYLAFQSVYQSEIPRKRREVTEIEDRKRMILLSRRPWKYSASRICSNCRKFLKRTSISTYAFIESMNERAKNWSTRQDMNTSGRF